MIVVPATRTDDVTFVIVAFHRPDALARSFAALADAPDLPVVVMNVGADPAVAAVVAAELSRRRVIVVEVSNDGYAAAVNRAVGVVTTEHVVFANDDVTITPDSLAQLLDVVRTARADVAMPRLLDVTGADEGTVRALPTPCRIGIEWALLPDRPPSRARRRATGTSSVQKWRRPRVTETVPAATAALVATRADLLRAVPLPESYFLYWEEIDWAWQLRDAGASVALVPSATAVHTGGRDDVRPDKQRLLARNAVRCVARTQGRGRALVTWPIVIAWQLRLLVVDALVPGRTRDRVAARAAGVSAAVGAWRELR